jgi:hypothetical protein
MMLCIADRVGQVGEQRRFFRTFDNANCPGNCLAVAAGLVRLAPEAWPVARRSRGLAIEEEFDILPLGVAVPGSLACNKCPSS